MAVPFYFVHPYFQRNIDELSLFLEGTNREFWFFTVVGLFEANWFATGNKCFLGQIFRTAQGRTTIQSCFELLGRGDEAKQKFKVFFLRGRENLVT